MLWAAPLAEELADINRVKILTKQLLPELKGYYERKPWKSHDVVFILYSTSLYLLYILNIYNEYIFLLVLQLLRFYYILIGFLFSMYKILDIRRFSFFSTYCQWRFPRYSRGFRATSDIPTSKSSNCEIPTSINVYSHQNLVVFSKLLWKHYIILLNWPFVFSFKYNVAWY